MKPMLSSKEMKGRLQVFRLHEKRFCLCLIPVCAYDKCVLLLSVSGCICFCCFHCWSDGLNWFLDFFCFFSPPSAQSFFVSIGAEM